MGYQILLRLVWETITYIYGGPTDPGNNYIYGGPADPGTNNMNNMIMGPADPETNPGLYPVES